MKNALAILTICLMSLSFYAQAGQGRIGLGYQGMFPASGIHAKYDVTDRITAQGVIGFWGTISTYAARGIYKFSDSGYPIYAFGTLSKFNYDGYLGTAADSVIGYGGGVGIEYNWQDLVGADIPPLHWNIELGFIGVSSSFGYSGLGGIFFGGGLTYYLDN